MEASTATHDIDPHQLPEKRAQVHLSLGPRRSKKSRPGSRWAKRARSIPVEPAPSLGTQPQPQAAAKAAPANRSTTIDELIPTGNNVMFTPLNAYRFIKHSRDSITRRLISSQEKSRTGSIHGEDSLKKLLYEEMLRLSFPKADKNIRMYFRGGSAIDKIGEIKPTASLHLFQQGFSFGSDDGNWHEYEYKSKQFFKAIDNGILPPFISELLKHTKWAFYDGYAVLEIYDYRDITDACPVPTIRRCLLRPTAETVVDDIERICDLKVVTKYDENHIESLKLALEERILRVNAPKICLEPTVRVLQVASIVGYNYNQKNVPTLSNSQIARCMKPSAARDQVQERGVPEVKPPSALALGCHQIPDVAGLPPMPESTRVLLRCASYCQHTQAGLASYSKNVLMNDFICRQTIFGPTTPTTDASGAPRLTIQSKVKIHAPGARPIKVHSPKPGDVRSLRFFAQRNMRQMHDLFIFSRPCRLGVPDPPVSSGTYEGILKITSEGDKKPDILRFNIGNHETTNNFVKAYIAQSQREGRVMLHDKDPSSAGPSAPVKYLTVHAAEPASASWPISPQVPANIKQDPSGQVKPASHMIPTTPTTPLPPTVAASAAADGRFSPWPPSNSAAQQMHQVLQQARMQLQAGISAPPSPSWINGSASMMPPPSKRSSTGQKLSRQPIKPN